MATTYDIISSTTLSSSTASVVFSSITSSYTDLVLRCSLRTTSGGTDDVIYMTLGTGSGNYHSITRFYTDHNTLSTNRDSNSNSSGFQNANGSTSLANTFATVEVYFPNYTSTGEKPFFVLAAEEDLSLTSWHSNSAGLFRSPSALSSITIAGNSGSFVSGSVLTLYGIKNS